MPGGDSPNALQRIVGHDKGDVRLTDEFRRFTPETGRKSRHSITAAFDVVDGSPPTASQCADPRQRWPESWRYISFC